MATSIKLIRRYVWLAETVRRAGRITIEEINRQWSRNTLLNDSHESEIPERTFHRHREGVAEIFGVEIVCDRRCGNEYYIGNPEALDDNSFTANLFTRLAVDNRLLDDRELSDRIIDEKMASGTSLLPMIIDALQRRVKLSFTYHSQFSDKVRQHIVEPQFLKKSRQRWYVIARQSSGKVIPFALDRIVSAVLTDDRFEFDRSIDPSTLFSDVIGVNLDSDYDKEKILVKVRAPQRNYLDHLPLHHSQRVVETTDTHTVYEYQLCAEYEFQHELMRMGESVEVLRPQWLRHQIMTFADHISASHRSDTITDDDAS